MLKRSLSLAVFSVCLLQTASFGIQTESIRIASYNDLIQGELENLSVSNLGETQIAPGVELLTKLGTEVIFDAVLSDTGILYMATANDGMVYEYDLTAPRSKQGQAEDAKDEEGSTSKEDEQNRSDDGDDGSDSSAAGEFFKPGPILSHALEIGPDGALYVAASPRGIVYRIKPGQRPEVYYNSGQMYIWDMLMDSAGALYVATGSEAKIFKLPANFKPGDEAIEWFSADASRFSSLAFDKDGHLLAASGPDSCLYRITAKGEGTVLYYAGTDEISEIHPADNGTIYFSTLHQGDLADNTSKTTALDLPALLEKASKASRKSSGGNSNGKNGHSSDASSPTEAPSFIYRLMDDGFADPVWSPGGRNILTFIPHNDGGFLAGTDDHARLFDVRSLTDWELVISPEVGGSISKIISTPGGDLLLLTSNPAAVYRMGKQPADKGIWTTHSLDANDIASWGRILPVGTGPDGLPEISWQSRTGNAPAPDDTWSKWAQMDGLATNAPKGRFLQLKATFESASTILRELTVFYLLNNAAPIVNRINIVPVGLEVIELAAPNKQAVSISALTGDKPLPESLPEAILTRTQVRTTGDNGQFSFGWNAFDPNDDALEYSIAVRKEGTPDWAVLASKLQQPVYSLNTRGMDDGYYRVKVTATDAPSNPPGTGRSGSLVSKLFLVDNAPPAVEISAIDIDQDQATVRIEVTDSLSVIRSAQYALDGGELQQAFPIGQIFDSRQARFEIKLEGLDAGAHTFVFQVEDVSQNTTKVQRVFVIQ